MRINDYNLAIANLRREGDTDIFPELDCSGVTFPRVEQLDRDISALSVSEIRAKYAPQPTYGLSFKNQGALREVVQLDPLFSVYYLMLAIGVGRRMEQRRVGLRERAVHSYRFAPNLEQARLFRYNFGYASYGRELFDRAQNTKTAGFLCLDLKDFYRSVTRGTLCRALLDNGIPKRTVMRILRLLDVLDVHGLPVGGNASRILAEVVLGEADRYLAAEKIAFVRFVDDYTLLLPRGASPEKVTARFSAFLSGMWLEINQKKIKYQPRRHFDIGDVVKNMADYETAAPYGHPHEEDLSKTHAKKFSELLTDTLTDEKIPLHILNRITVHSGIVDPVAIQMSHLLWWMPRKFPAVCRWMRRMEPHMSPATRDHIAAVACRMFQHDCPALKSSVNRLHAALLLGMGRQDDVRACLAGLPRETRGSLERYGRVGGSKNIL